MAEKVFFSPLRSMENQDAATILAPNILQGIQIQIRHGVEIVLHLRYKMVGSEHRSWEQLWGPRSLERGGSPSPGKAAVSQAQSCRLCSGLLTKFHQYFICLIFHMQPSSRQLWGARATKTLRDKLCLWYVHPHQAQKAVKHSQEHLILWFSGP